ncbi:MAG: apolipoprotein N-acyltransferase [Thalassotalea sp.]
MFKKLAGNIFAFINNKTNGLSFLAGLSLVLAYAPYGLWWLPFIALPAWLYLTDTASNLKKTQSTYAFALGWFTAGISWVHVSIADFGGLPIVFSLLLMFLLCMYLAIYPALAVWLTNKLPHYLKAKQAPAPAFNLWLLPSFWLLTEYLRAVVMTGFPWLSLGYTQIDSPLSALAPVIGEIGLSFVLMLTSVALVKLVQRKNLVIASLTLIIIGLSVVASSFQSWVTVSDKTIKTALIQGNIAQELKWLPEKEWPTLERYFQLTEQQENIDLYVWPESAIPALEPNVQDYLAVVDEALHKKNAALITGIINYNFEARSFFNNLITLGNKNADAEKGSYRYGHSNRYSKHHLLPIGEFVPFGDLLRPLAPLFNLPMSSFSRGDIQQQNLIAKDLHILPLICFEIAFADQLATNLTEQTQLLLTVSNDAWFADSHGPHQHMEIARMRALEFARPLLRSTNTGITAAVDHRGQFINKLPQFEEAVLVSDIQLVEGKTPYFRYGNTSIYLLALICLILALISTRTTHQESR